MMEMDKIQRFRRNILIFLIVSTAMTMFANAGVAVEIEETEGNSKSGVPFEPMELELSVGIYYSKSDSYENLRLIRRRDVSIPISMSTSLSRKASLSLRIPFLYSQSEYTAFNESVNVENSEVGSLSAGVSLILLKETSTRPGLNTTLGLSFPRGQNIDPVGRNNRSDDFSIGVSTKSASISMTKSIDPAEVSANLGYTYRDQSYGDIVSYGFGVGFAVNSALSLSGQFSGSYIFNDVFNGTEIVGTGSEPVSVDLGVSYRISEQLNSNASVTFGLNDDAGDATIGFSYTYTLRSK